MKISRRKLLGAASGLALATGANAQRWVMPQAALSSASWQALKIGAGGLNSNLSIANDNTLVMRQDTYGAYIWNPNAPAPTGNDNSVGAWQSLATISTMANVLATLGIPPTSAASAPVNQGFYEIQLDPNVATSRTAWAMWAGYFLKCTNMPTQTNGYAGTPLWGLPTSFSPSLTFPLYAGGNDNYRTYAPKIAIHPTNTNIVFLGTPDNGVYACTDGTNFIQVSTGQLPATASHQGYLIIFNPADGTKAYAQDIGGSKIYYSTNANLGSSSTWSWINNGTGPGGVVTMAVSTTGVLYAVGAGSLYSYTPGTGWATEINDGTVGCVACDPSTGNHVIAVQQGNTNFALAETTIGPGGHFSTWSQTTYAMNDVPWIGNHGAYGVSPYNAFLDRSNPHLLYANGNQTSWTASWSGALNSGTTVNWVSRSTGLEALTTACIVVSNAGVVTGALDFGAFLHNYSKYAPYNTAGSPYPLNPGLAAAWSLDVPGNDNTFIAGVIDAQYGGQNTQYSGFSINGGTTWSAWPNFPPGYSTPSSPGGGSWGGCIAAASNNNVLWGGNFSATPYYTLNRGSTWRSLGDGGSSFFAKGNVIAAAGSTYVSATGATSITLTSPITQGAVGFPVSLTSCNVAGLNGMYHCTGISGGGTVVSFNGPPGLGSVSITSGYLGGWDYNFTAANSVYTNSRLHCADRVNANTFYLVIMGFDTYASTPKGFGVFKSTNGGTDWTNVFAASNSTDYFTGGLGIGVYQAVQTMPGQAGYLFYSVNAQAAGNNPAGWSSNAGGNWNPFPTAISTDRCFVLGFGAPSPTSVYSTIYIVGIVNGVYGIFYSTTGGVGGFTTSSWQLLTTGNAGKYANNTVDLPVCISGDPNIFGRVYIGLAGSGFAQFG